VENPARHPVINDQAGALLRHGKFRVNRRTAKPSWSVPESDDFSAEAWQPGALPRLKNKS
jgi:hypothetical protein